MTLFQQFIPGNKINNDLYKAIFSGDVETVSFIIDMHGLSYQPAWANGHQLLLTALDCRSIEVAKFLIKQGCRLKDTGSKSVVHFAVRLGEIDLVAQLLERHPDALSEIENGNSLLHIAIEQTNADMVSFLLNRGIEIESRNTGGLTPLQLASVIGQSEIIEIILKSGCDIESKDQNGKTSLFLAVSSGHKSAVRTLLKYGPSCCCRSNNGYITPLLDATSKAYVDIVKDLIAYGADLNEKTRLGQTALHIACMHKNKNMIFTLLNAGADVNVTDLCGMVPSDAIVKKVTPGSTFFEDSSISYMLGKHFLKMKIAGFPLNKKNSLFFDTFYNMYCNEIVVGNVVFSTMSNVIHTTMKTCSDEIEKMKNMRISHESSVYDLFERLKDPLSLISEHEMNYFKSCDLDEVLPSYAVFINNSLRQMKLRKNLINSSQEYLFRLLDRSELKLPILPEEMMFKILTYFTNDELKRFNQISEDMF